MAEKFFREPNTPLDERLRHYFVDSSMVPLMVQARTFPMRPPFLREAPCSRVACVPSGHLPHDERSGPPVGQPAAAAARGDPPRDACVRGHRRRRPRRHAHPPRPVVGARAAARRALVRRAGVQGGHARRRARAVPKLARAQFDAQQADAPPSRGRVARRRTRLRIAGVGAHGVHTRAARPAARAAEAGAPRSTPVRRSRRRSRRHLGHISA